MIVGIEGTVESRGVDHVVVRLGGVSLMVHVPTSSLGKLGRPGDPVRLHTFLHVREEGLFLYGFISQDELDLFRSLITVSGVGPKSALSLLSAMSVNEITGAIVTGDADHLTRVPGIGRKTAERLIVELKDKLEKSIRTGVGLAAVTGAVQAGNDRESLIAALTALGYSMREVNRVIDSLTTPAEAPLEEKVKEALRMLARR
ncbi:MAG: Holliday junction branch migration protein RuvA [Dehalococcoidia bacterium]|nr:Holliday junction branch migration protein RuvA [Dehalococcoidia bacterium]